jgi:hypothetical protein
MQEQVNLEEITDIKDLKLLKSDQYDILEAAQRQVQASQQNIQNINVRITQLNSEQEKPEPPASIPAEATAPSTPPAENS